MTQAPYDRPLSGVSAGARWISSLLSRSSRRCAQGPRVARRLRSRRPRSGSGSARAAAAPLSEGRGLISGAVVRSRCRCQQRGIPVESKRDI